VISTTCELVAHDWRVLDVESQLWHTCDKYSNLVSVQDSWRAIQCLRCDDSSRRVGQVVGVKSRLGGLKHRDLVDNVQLQSGGLSSQRAHWRPIEALHDDCGVGWGLLSVHVGGWYMLCRLHTLRK